MTPAETLPLPGAVVRPGRLRRRGAELEFLPAALELIETPVSPAGRITALALVLFLAIAIAWSWFGHVDIIATAPGKIVPAGKVKLVQPLESGIVAAIRVQDGDHVAAGDVLIELDPTAAREDQARLAGDLLQADLDVARLSALRQDVETGRGPGVFVPPAGAGPRDIERALAALRAQAASEAGKVGALDQQVAEKLAEAAETAATVAKLEAGLPILQQMVEMRRHLLDIQYGNRFALLEAQQQLIAQQRELPVQHRHAEAIAAARLALERQREQIRADYAHSVLGDLAEAEKKRDELRHELAKADQKARQTVLAAPVSGTVQQLAIHTVGGVVTPAQSLLVIVPDDHPLIIEAMVRNDDVGFVHAGQAVAVKVETFLFTRYGLLNGRVIDVSRAALEDEGRKPEATGEARSAGKGEAAKASAPAYVARIALETTTMTIEGHEEPLGPGMAVTAEIKTGRRRIIDYLLSPLRTYADESLRER